MAIVQARSCKHRDIFAALRRDIQAGGWRPGTRLPSEAQLTKRFGVSRITVARAVRDLQQAGLVTRRAGAGTFVAGAAAPAAHSFGLLIPDLGQTDIFEPICQGMMASPLAGQHALLWGGTQAPDRSADDRAWELCQQYIERKVSGVFFAPLEWSDNRDDVNVRIGRAFDAARIPQVLLDRPLLPYPAASRHDVVGIDNWRGGHAVAEHLLHAGCRRIAFVAHQRVAATVDVREAGYREALYRHHLDFTQSLAVRIDPADTEAIAVFMEGQHPDGIICANDRTAAVLMRTLLHLGYRIPRDVRLVSFDDVDYARLLPVPLTTLRQPTRQIGETALSVMLERIARPDLPPRHVQLQCDLIVRESSS